MGRLNRDLLDPRTYARIAYLLLAGSLGIAEFVFLVTALSLGVGLAVTLVGIPILIGSVYAWGWLAEVGSNEDPALTAQMSDLRDARSRIIEAADAERRRIERDLHDGAQQRLVALSLNLRMAEKRAADGDPKAAELVRSASEEAGLALKELRDLARGIHPAMLTNCGLAAALDDLAGRAAVPVELVAVPSERLPAQVESAAYFLVSECLANVGKHARATRATVAVTVVGEEVEVIVKDDGVGGAELGNGSGLQGLEDRVGALDGCVDVDSPPGGGTTVMATIPLAEPSGAPAARPALSEDEVRALAARRRRGLGYRLIGLGTVGFVIVAIWGLTGAGYFWPAWVLLGSAAALALKAIPWSHAWHDRMHGASYES